MKKVQIFLGMLMVMTLMAGCGKAEKASENNIYQWANNEELTQGSKNKNDKSTVSIGGCIYNKDKKIINPYEDEAIVYDGMDLEFYVRVENTGKRAATICMSAMIEGVLQPYRIEGGTEEQYSETIELKADGEYDFHITLNPIDVNMKNDKIIKFVIYASAGIERVKQDDRQPALFTDLGCVKIRASDKNSERTVDKKKGILQADSIEKTEIRNSESSLNLVIKKNKNWESILTNSKINSNEKIYTCAFGYKEEVQEYTLLYYVDGKLQENIAGGHQVYFKAEKDKCYYFETKSAGVPGEHLVALVMVPSKYQKNCEIDVIDRHNPVPGYEIVMKVTDSE